ncbi:hypothetical protein QQS21_007088 [Conoideocrella luteorostrata]|uniref:Uncharacterized protein n=1 Tax=Conoideocrella luteorostrata TaxID=1105319 RepID=A0AAJ0FXQ3_9HYPO|nr:hypothetical protein QQS21_007088 [Conoideocrella luteorostrata]
MSGQGNSHFGRSQFDSQSGQQMSTSYGPTNNSAAPPLASNYRQQQQHMAQGRGSQQGSSQQVQNQGNFHVPHNLNQVSNGPGFSLDHVGQHGLPNSAAISQQLPQQDQAGSAQQPEQQVIDIDSGISSLPSTNKAIIYSRSDTYAAYLEGQRSNQAMVDSMAGLMNSTSQWIQMIIRKEDSEQIQSGGSLYPPGTGTLPQSGSGNGSFQGDGNGFSDQPMNLGSGNQ